MDVLPLYIVLMSFLPLHPVADAVEGRPHAGAVGRALCHDLGVRSVSVRLSQRLLGVQSVRLAIAVRVRRLVRARWRAAHVAGSCRRGSRSWISIAYLFAAFCVTLTWYLPQLSFLMPRWLEQWMYPINKTDLDVLRFAHFLALAALTVRFLPKDWPGLKSPWLRPLILCGQHSLEIFCLGVFLAFAGHFILAEEAGGAAMHFLISISGIVIMSAAAWLFSWYKHSADKSASRKHKGTTGADADLGGRGFMKSVLRVHPAD